MYNKHKLLAFAFVLILFFYSSDSVFAQVIINEFSSGTTSDWIELYNISTESANLSLYRLEDKAGNTKPLSGNLSPGGFLSFDWSNRLDNSGDSFGLIRISDSIILDDISYGSEGGVCAPGSSQSAGRVDNGNTIERFATPTKDATNVGAQLDPCPTPTPEPTNTPTPSPTIASTATPTSTPTKTPTPSPTSTKSPTPKATSTPIETLEIPETLVLGIEDKSDEKEASESQEGKKGFSLLPFLFVAAGLICIGTAILLVFRRGRAYNKKSEENS